MNTSSLDDIQRVDAPPTGCCAPFGGLRWSMEEAEALAAQLKALAHPVRLQIVGVLSRLGGQVCVCDLEAHFDLAQPTISHHLKVLRQAGLIESEQRGVWVYYRLRPATVARLHALTRELASE